MLGVGAPEGDPGREGLSEVMSGDKLFQRFDRQLEEEWKAVLTLE
jgi:hypothetical protein